MLARTLLLTLILGGLSAAPAATITLSATASGTYFDKGTKFVGNYATGWWGAGQEETRGYFVFDLGGLDGVVTSAVLRLELYRPDYSTFQTSDLSETIALYSVSTAAALIQGAGGVAAFTDLGDGDQLGSLLVTKSGAPDFVEITLNAAGLAALTPGQTIVLGAALTSLSRGATTEALFNNSLGTMTRELVIEYTPSAGPSPSPVPEPASLLLAGAGLVALGLVRRRQTKR